MAEANLYKPRRFGKVGIFNPFSISDCDGNSPLCDSNPDMQFYNISDCDVVTYQILKCAVCACGSKNVLCNICCFYNSFTTSMAM